LVLALSLALIAALPFITRPGLPRGTDAELHVFRAAEMGYSLRAGDLYPRWAPDFYYGYGYPIFNYYAPLTYYVANLFDLLPQTDIVGGVKLVFVLGLAGAAGLTFLFVRDWLGPRPALLAAALYLFSPYVFFIDPYMRGVLAESFSLGLFPGVLWAFRRLLEDGRRRWWILGAILLAALIMSHNLLGVVFTGLLLLYLCWELGSRWIMRRRSTPHESAPGWPLAGRVLLVLVLGLGLSAIFWLPVALERDQVQLSLTGPGHFDFHNHFLSVGQLLAPSPVLDLGAVAPRFAFNLGWPQWLLALAGLLALRWRDRDRHFLSGFFLFCSAGLILLLLPVSTPIWESVPEMAFLQFPWRLLGPVALTLSLTAAAGFAYVTRERRWADVALAVAVGLTLFMALPTMFPPLWNAEFGPTDPAAMIEFELTAVAVGTTSTGDYLPETVEILPHPEPAYLATYSQPGGVDKVNRATLPQNTTVEVLSHGPTHDRFRVSSGKPFILRLFTFYFPGWQATVDGEPVPIELGRPEGFITVPVPAGDHIVEVRLGAWATPARAVGTWIAFLSGGALLLLAVVRRPVLERVSEISNSRRRRADHLDRRSVLINGGLVLSFFLFKVGIVDWQHSWFRRTSPPGQVLGAQISFADRPIKFGEHIRLIGYDLPRSQVRAGNVLPLTLYWQATAPVPNNYQVFAHLTQPATHLWAQSDNLNPGDLPTSRWPLDKHVWDDHALAVLPGTPPGTYHLTVGLYTLADGVRLPVVNADGVPLGDTFTLPTPVHVVRPLRPPAQDTLNLTQVLDVPYDAGVSLLGVVLPDRRIELPGFVHLSLLWRARVDTPDDVLVRVQLLDAQDRVVDEIVTPPVDGHYPSSGWTAGEIVRDQYSFWLSPDVEPGTYQLRMTVNGDADWTPLGTIESVAP
jgi:hypothetical protein